jgi:hypothetical protein
MKMRLHLLELDDSETITASTEELTLVQHEGRICLDCTYAPEERSCLVRSPQDVIGEELYWKNYHQFALVDQSLRSEDDCLGEEEYTGYSWMEDFYYVPPADPSEAWVHPDYRSYNFEFCFGYGQTPEEDRLDQQCDREFDDLCRWLHQQSRHKRRWYPVKGAWAHFQRWMSARQAGKRLRRHGSRVAQARQRKWNETMLMNPGFGWPQSVAIPGLYQRATNDMTDCYADCSRILGSEYTGKRQASQQTRRRNRNLCLEQLADYLSSGNSWDDWSCEYDYDCDDFDYDHSYDYARQEQGSLNYRYKDETTGVASTGGTTKGVSWHGGGVCTALNPCGRCDEPHPTQQTFYPDGKRRGSRRRNRRR